MIFEPWLLGGKTSEKRGEIKGKDRRSGRAKRDAGGRASKTVPDTRRRGAYVRSCITFESEGASSSTLRGKREGKDREGRERVHERDVGGGLRG